MNSQNVSNLWWTEILERCGRIAPETQPGLADDISSNPVYARSLARAYLAELAPPAPREKCTLVKKAQAA